MQYMGSGPIVAIILEGKNAISTIRKMNGATKIEEASPGTIRFDLALDKGRNLVHGSDSVESAAREINIWFKNEVLVDPIYNRFENEFIEE